MLDVELDEETRAIAREEAEPLAKGRKEEARRTRQPRQAII